MKQLIKNHFPSSLVIIAIILTAIVIGGEVYWWASLREEKMNNEIISLRNQLDQSKVNAIKNQSDELVETKFKLAILDFWQVREVFVDPQNKNKFYYVTNFGDGGDIWVYDLDKDKNYQQKGIFSLPEGNTLLFNQQLDKNQEFRGVGIIGDKFVFVETSVDNSPGPCFTPWLYNNLEYIDLGSSELTRTRKPFILPEDLKKSEDLKISDCLKDLPNW